MDVYKINRYSGKILPVVMTVLSIFTCQEVPQNKAPAIADLIVYPSQPKAGQIALLTAVASDEDGDPLSYHWMASGGTFLDTLGANPIQWQAPTDPDTISFYLKVSDPLTASDKTYSFYLEEGIASVAGHVTDQSSGYLLSNATIEIRGETLITGTDGYYVFTDIVAGDNIPISAMASNYVTFADLIDVHVGENIVDISLTLLTEVGRIAGYVTDSVTGNKLAGAIVQTGDIADTTAADGYYELYNVPLSENVPVRATLDGYSIYSNLITVAAGYNTNNIALEPNIASISGRVTAAADGALLEGVAVTINQHTDTTNAAGFYQILDIPVISNASVSAVLDGYVTAFSVIDIAGGSNHLDLSMAENPGTLSGWVRSTLDGGVLEDIAIRIGQSTVVTNADGYYEATGLAIGPVLVVCETEGFADYSTLEDIQPGENSLDIDLVPNVGSVSGFLRDSLAGVSLAEEIVYLDENTTTTEADGAFLFEAVAIGQHLLSVSLSDYQNYSVILDVVAGVNTRNILLVPASGSLVGLVKDDLTMEVISGAEISVGEQQVTTDDEGYYELTGVDLGAVQLSCTATGYEQLEEMVTVEFGENIVNLNLSASHGSLVGLVMDSTNSSGLDSVRVTVNGDTVTTNAEGYYEFESLAIGSAQNLVAWRSGYSAHQEWITIEPGENTVNISLSPDHGSLAGWITDSATTAGLDSVAVIADGDTVTTNAEGYYEFESVPAGTALDLKAQRAGYVNYQEWIDISPGENTRNITLTASGG